ATVPLQVPSSDAVECARTGGGMAATNTIAAPAGTPARATRRRERRADTRPGPNGVCFVGAARSRDPAPNSIREAAGRPHRRRHVPDTRAAIPFSGDPAPDAGNGSASEARDLVEEPQVPEEVSHGRPERWSAARALPRERGRALRLRSPLARDRPPAGGARRA